VYMAGTNDIQRCGYTRPLDCFYYLLAKYKQV